jgi:NCAIR mutase (PurE)-related protein
MAEQDVILDLDRGNRTGLPEAVICEGKTAEQIVAAVQQAEAAGHNILLTRLDPDRAGALPLNPFDYDPLSRTAVAGPWTAPSGAPGVAVVAAGTSDLPVAREAVRTLAFLGIAAREYADVGVAGLWRLLRIREELAAYPAIIAVAGMEGGLFSVLGGLVPGMVVAVPTSRGYGICRNGETALHSALASCAPGIVAVNIDNGYGAACAAARMLPKATLAHKA